MKDPTFRSSSLLSFGILASLPLLASLVHRYIPVVRQLLRSTFEINDELEIQMNKVELLSHDQTAQIYTLRNSEHLRMQPSACQRSFRSKV